MAEIKLTRLEMPTPSQLAQLQRVCDEAPGYFLACEGKAAKPEQAARWFDGHNLPPGYTEDDHFIFGIELEGVLIGTCHVLRGWKTPEQSIIGLLLLSEKHQRQGIGGQVYCMTQAIIHGWHGMRSVRIGVIETNAQAFPFWHKMGFVENGERYKLDEFIADVIILEKPLS